MAGPSRAAPPMPDPLDPAEFDAPPPADPGADYRVLLDAMRQAGADGIAQQSAALVPRIEQDARQRLEWGQRMGTAVDDLQPVAGQLQRVSAGIWRDRLKEWLTAALIGLGERQSGVEGKDGSEGVESGGSRVRKKKNKNK